MFLLLWAPALLACASVIEAATNPTVTIASGTIIGTATGVLNQPSSTGLANAYLGIPFASPPTGSLRFSPPAPPAKWSKPFVAQKQPPACLQQFFSGSTGAAERSFFNNPLLPPPPESEDCLYLNVFAPRGASPTNTKAVMFWLFGGNLQFGTAGLAYYNGSSFAVNQDVVVVVPNYRTNFFGFSNSPQIPFGKQNSGFLDQRFALQWVQDNIKAFGGDPSKVTLFGESAGAYSVKQLLANPPTTPSLPYRAAILESQQTALIGNGTTAYNQVAANFSCSAAASTIDCLRKVPGTAIQAYIINQGLQFPPVLNDGTYTASNSLPAIVSGKFANVPILIGTNKDEGRVFVALTGLDDGNSVVDEVLALTGLNISSIESSLLAMYSAEIVDSPYLLVSQILTDIAFTCTTSTLSSAIALAGRQPVWRYRFDAAFNNTQLFEDAGAYHTVEIPSVWGTYFLSNQLGPATPAQIKLSQYMQGAWASFAKNPTGGPGWPKLGSAAGVELAVLGGVYNASGEATRPLVEADAVCALYDPLLLAIGQSY